MRPAPGCVLRSAAVLGVRVLGLSAAIAACGGVSGGGYAYRGDDLPREKDGLVLVERFADFDLQYLRPGIDFSPYHAIFAPPLQLVYSEEFERDHRLDRARGAERMTPTARLDAYRETASERLRELFRDSLSAGVTHDGAYRLVDEPGPGVLVLNAAIIDLDLEAGRTAYPDSGSSGWLSRPVVIVGASLRDGASGERLAELLQAIPPEGSTLEPRESFWPDLSEAFDRWARDLRSMLDRSSEAQRYGE